MPPPPNITIVLDFVLIGSSAVPNQWYAQKGRLVKPNRKKTKPKTPKHFKNDDTAFFSFSLKGILSSGLIRKNIIIEL
jgi:hypothetical protein